MSLLEKYLYGWRRRSSRPSFDPDETHRVIITGFDDATATARARVGDSVLRVDGTTREHVDTVARVRVTEFDDGAAQGRAELLEVVGEAVY